MKSCKRCGYPFLLCTDICATCDAVKHLPRDKIILKPPRVK